jgi:hypothetical protein
MSHISLHRSSPISTHPHTHTHTSIHPHTHRRYPTQRHRLPARATLTAHHRIRCMVHTTSCEGWGLWLWCGVVWCGEVRRGEGREVWCVGGWCVWWCCCAEVGCDGVFLRLRVWLLENGYNSSTLKMKTSIFLCIFALVLEESFDSLFSREGMGLLLFTVNVDHHFVGHPTSSDTFPDPPTSNPNNSMKKRSIQLY